MKVWITKYALTTGVFQRVVKDVGDGMVVDERSGYPAYYHGDGRDWHRTRKSAAERVEVMRLAKLASLKKQIAKLQRPIEVPE